MPATIFSGDSVKTLKDILNLNDKALIISGLAEDPTVDSFAAPIGSLYIRTDGQHYRKLDNGDTTNWELIGSNAGVGGRNIFLANESNFEVGVANWIQGAAITIAGTTLAGQVLTEGQSGLISKTATDANGQFVALQSQTIPLADRGRTLLGQFEFLPLSGYVSGDLEVEVFDDTNAEVIFVADAAIPNQKGLFQYLINTQNTTEQITVRLKVANSNTNAFTASIDEFIAINRSPTPVANLGDWEPFTPSTSANVISPTATGQVKRVGDTAKLQISLSSASAGVGASPVLIGIPPGLVIDRSKLESDATRNIVGFASTNNVFTDGYGNSNNEIWAVSVDTATDQLRLVAPNQVPTAFLIGSRLNAGYQVDITCEVPIEGWTAGNVISSNETALRPINGKALMNSTQNLTGLTIPMRLDEVEYGIEDQFDLPNSEFTVRKKGRYLVIAQASGAVPGAADRRVAVSVQKNPTTPAAADGVNVAFSDGGQNANDIFGITNIAIGIVELNAGDTLVPYLFGTAGTVMQSFSSNQGTFFLVEEMPDLSVFGAIGGSEYLQSSSSSEIAWPIAANTWGDIGSITVQPGEHDLTGIANLRTSGAFSAYAWFFAITDQPGNSTVNQEDAVNLIRDGRNGGGTNNRNNMVLPNYRVKVSEPTTFYLKSFITSTTNINLSGFRISSRQIPNS